MTEIASALDRQPSVQIVNWLLNLRRFGQLELNPPYQRKSVWSQREKQSFLDTVLRNYPSPAIFLHLTYDEEGNPTYHVVDGKQRLSTIFDFVDGKIRLAKTFGDARLDGANWKVLKEVPAARKSFWNYQLTVELIDDVHEPLVREIFERLNKNSRKLEAQEIRHAKFDGWLINFLERTAAASEWKDLGISTTARQRRMADVQLISEFAQSRLNPGPVGFDQDALDAMYAEYEDPDLLDYEFDSDTFEAEFNDQLHFVFKMNQHNGCIKKIAGSKNHLYSLWTALSSANLSDIAPEALSETYLDFIETVDEVRRLDREDPTRDRTNDNPLAAQYAGNSVGAATEPPQRSARHEALSRALQLS